MIRAAGLVTALACSAISAFGVCAAADAAPIAEVGAPSAVAAYGTAVAWSAYSDATRRYTLMVRDGAGTRAAGVPTRRVAFDVDAGPGPGGRTLLTYSRCADDPTFAAPLDDAGCRLYGYALPNGPERAIAVRRVHGFSDTHPSIWHGRIAWVRRADGGSSADRPRVMPSRLADPRDVTTTHLVTERRCWRNYDPSPPRICGPTHDRKVVGLDVGPRAIAISEQYSCPQARRGASGGCGGGFGQRDVRVTRPGRSPIRVADTVAGLGGQAFVGPTFDGGGLYFGRSCLGDPGACVNGGARIVRYDLDTRRFTRAPGPRRLYGLGVTAGRVFELAEPVPDRGCSLFYMAADQRPAGQGPCTLVDAGALTFTTVGGGRRP